MSAQRESKLKLNKPNHVSVRKQKVHVLDFGSFLHATFAVFLINSVSCLPHGGWPSFYFKTVIDSCVVSDPSVGVTVSLQVSFVKEAIMKVLNLVLIFSDRWQAGFGAWK